jgi:hypothetical protein
MGVVLETNRSRTSRIVPFIPLSSHFIGGRRKTHPESNFERPFSQALLSFAFQFQGANQRRGPHELI